MFFLRILLFLLFPLFIHAHPTLSFQKLEGLADHLSPDAAVRHLERNLFQFHDHDVQIRGFLYQRNDGIWILSPDPNLKTCCIGTKRKISQQVVVDIKDHHKQSTGISTLEGHFIVSPQWDDEGTLVQLYKLQNAHLMPGRWPFSSWVLSSIGLISISLLWILIRKKNR